MATLQQLFHHHVIKDVVSRLQGPVHKLQQVYGMGPGGINTEDVGGDKFGWDLMDRTRNIAQGRLRDSPAATVSPQKVGTVYANTYRMAEQIPLSYDAIFRNRRLGGMLGDVDVRGERYLTKQVGYQRERFMNAREMLTAWAFRGGFELQIQGDEVIPVPSGTGAPIVVDFKHPATHQGTVEGVFAGNWDDPVAGKVIKELMDLNDHSARNSRYALTKAWCRSSTAYNVIVNDETKGIAGTSRSVTMDGRGRLAFDGSQNDQGQLSNINSFILHGYQNIEWCIYDDNVILPDGSVEPFLNDGEVLFTPDPDGSWMCWKNGSEMVSRAVSAPAAESFGMDMWVEEVRNPTGLALFAVDNGLPAPQVPTAWYLATVYTP